MNTQDTVEKYVKEFHQHSGFTNNILRVMLTTAIEEARKEEREKIVEWAKNVIQDLKYQNSLQKDGVVIKNAKNGGYVLNDHQMRMDDLFHKALVNLTTSQP
jgi:hypothetical protein